MQIGRPLDVLLPAAAGARPRLVLDGIDRLLDGAAIAASARQGRPVAIDIQAEADRIHSDFMGGRLAGDLPCCREVAALPLARPEATVSPLGFAAD